MNRNESFLKELHVLLKKYKAEITVDDHYSGYPECGQDLRMTVEFDWEIDDDIIEDDIDLGWYIDKDKHGGK